MKPAFDVHLQARLETTGVVAVLVIDRAEDGPPLAQALLAGGIDGMELTLRTPAALDALRAIRREVPGMLAGIGTILTQAQVAQAVEAGGAFGVSPGTNPHVLVEAARLGLSFAPGVAVPSDVERALECGCRLLKFFPAEPSGGLAFLKAMAAPYAHLGIKYLPLGGLTPANMSSYLAEPSVAALGGSWLAPRELVQKQDWAAIAARAADARAIVTHARGAAAKRG
jgi:2-dehydro-3-deoxyphosphogluconate aldolase/(4S)-4-hydroxy-2-oxoglutarate aldolase